MKQRADESNRQIAHELETERAHHQRLVKEHGRLQQRYHMITIRNLKSGKKIISSLLERTILQIKFARFLTVDRLKF